MASSTFPSEAQLRHGSSNSKSKNKIALIGSGTIGLSFAALHLDKNPSCQVSIFDTRPDLYEYITTHLPSYLLESLSSDSWQDRLTIAPNLKNCVEFADIVQEQGPENLTFKKGLWPEVEKHARSDALFWSSTSGIPASAQNQDMRDKGRLLVVHPYNPPHVMPLLEVVPSPQTKEASVNKTLKYWRGLGRTPVVIKKECTGFVANRLAFALFREASSLVSQGVVTVKDLDTIVTSSMGPRWSIAGPFKAYHAGGGEGGLASLMDKIGDTVQACWDTSKDDIEREKIDVGQEWQEKICKQTDEEYGNIDNKERDFKTRKVLQAVQEKAG